MTKLTAQEIQTKLEQVASISIEALQLTTAKELKDLCRGIVHNWSKLTKADMVTALLEVTKSIRDRIVKVEEIKQLEQLTDAETELIKKYEERFEIEHQNIERKLPDSALVALNWYGNKSESELHPINIGVKIYKEIKATVNTAVIENQADKIPVVIGGYAANLASNERATYPSVTTRKSRKTDYLKAIQASFENDKDIAYRDTLENAISAFRNMMHQAFKSEVVEYHNTYKSEVSAKNFDREVVDYSKLIIWAKTVLNNPEKYKWTEIVKALSFSIGRRPSEILCSGQFTVIDSHHLTFKGQAKRRANFNPDEVLEVPTMVNTSLVLAGLNRLAEKDRKYEYDVNDHVSCMAICDKKTSKEISRDSKDSFSPKELRAIYGELTYKVFANESTSQNIWFQQVLGHGENQTETANSYIKYYIPETEVENLKSMVFS